MDSNMNKKKTIKYQKISKNIKWNITFLTRKEPCRFSMAFSTGTVGAYLLKFQNLFFNLISPFESNFKPD